MDPLPEVDEYIKCYLPKIESAYIKNRKYAFWHDVGVTSLGAASTVLVGVGASQDSILKFITLSLTAFITVFSACDHFFKFRSKSDACRIAVRSLRQIQGEITLIRVKDANNPENHQKISENLLKRAQKAVDDADLITEEGSVIPDCKWIKEVVLWTKEVMLSLMPEKWIKWLNRNKAA